MVHVVIILTHLLRECLYTAKVGAQPHLINSTNPIFGTQYHLSSTDKLALSLHFRIIMPTLVDFLI